MLTPRRPARITTTRVEARPAPAPPAPKPARPKAVGSHLRISRGRRHDVELGECRACGRPVLIGDAVLEPCALLTRCDPEPISRVAEALAHMHDVLTYSIVTVGAGRSSFKCRDRTIVRWARDLGMPRPDVYRPHTCPARYRPPKGPR